MKEIRFTKCLVMCFCLVSMFSVFAWGGAACRPTTPTGEDKTVNNDSGTPTDDATPTDDKTPPKDDPKVTDENTKPKEITISDIQNPDSPNHVKKGGAVILKGVVAVSPMFTVSSSTGLKGFFVAEGTFPTKKWGGILVVVDPDFTETIAIGDKLDIEGAVDEFSNSTQLNARAQSGGNITKVGTVPAADIKAVVVKPEDIPGEPSDKTAPDSSKAEPYESVLVELKDVTVMEGPDQYGLFKLEGGVVVDDNFFKGYRPKKGDKIAYIRGIIYYYFDLYRLIPRNSGDIDGAVPGCTKNEDCQASQKCENEQCSYFDCADDSECRGGTKCNTARKRCELPQKTATVMDIQNPASANHIPKDNPVELKGVVVTSPVYEVSTGKLKGFFVSDPTFPKEWGSVMVVVSFSWAETVEVGDVIDIVGRTSEYYDNTQVSIDLAAEGKLTKTGTNMKDKVVAHAITLADLPPKPADSKKPNDSPSEKFEGTLVELKDVTVESEADKNGEWTINGGLKVDDALFASTPKVGDKFKVLRGVVQYAFGSYRLLPRSADDLQQ
jgi:predicted extracellular nuclease